LPAFTENATRDSGVHDGSGKKIIRICSTDSKYYTRPFSIKTVLMLLPDSDLFEYICAENEKDRVHLGK